MHNLISQLVSDPMYNLLILLLSILCDDIARSAYQTNFNTVFILLHTHFAIKRLNPHCIIQYVIVSLVSVWTFDYNVKKKSQTTYSV